jgi:hypothetical protein
MRLGERGGQCVCGGGGDISWNNRSYDGVVETWTDQAFKFWRGNRLFSILHIVNPHN